jgi:hypothetical protein
MAYLGNTPTTQSFISGTDYFNGTGAQTAFTLTRTVASVNDIEAVVNNVVQQPNDAYNISGTTITFTSAPSAGTNNVYVRYLSTTTQAITPSQNTVGWAQLNADTQQDLGISYKNRIINGNMVISQRWGTSAVSDATNTNPYLVDRWSFYGDPASKVTLQQNQGSVTPPPGFINYMGLTSTSAYSPAAGDAFRFQQIIEGLNIADLAWGTANARTVTVSFWVRSSLTGTFGGALSNSALNRSYPFAYTISSANTWEYKTATIPGDTTGTWLTDNGNGIRLFFDVGCGSTTKGPAGAWASAFYAGVTGGTNVVATNGATFQFTGVQLEVGTQATTFTTAGGSYGAELALCQRYYWQSSGIAAAWNYLGSGLNFSTTLGMVYVQYPVQMRSAPSVSTFGTINNTNVQLVIAGAGVGATAVASVGSVEINNLATRIDLTSSGLTAGQACIARFAQNTGVTFSSEL